MESNANIIASLDSALALLRLEPRGDGWFEVTGAQGMFDHIFGGQLLGQSVMAACATVPDKALHSLHGYFIRGGDPRENLHIQVEVLRDGRNMATRRVNIFQQERLLFSLLASFHQATAAGEWEAPCPVRPSRDDMPAIQHWAARAPEQLARGAGTWIDRPPPVEMLIPEAPRFMGGTNDSNLRTHWMRLPRDVGDDPVLHQALLAYCSDYLLLDMAMHRHPGLREGAAYGGVSLDHSLWFHRPVRFDQWHSYTQTAHIVAGDRALARGEIRNDAGQIIATAVQEILVLGAN